MVWQDYYAQNEHYKDLQREARAQALVHEATSDRGILAWFQRRLANSFSVTLVYFAANQ